MCVFVGCVCVPKSSSLKVAKPKNEANKSALSIGFLWVPPSLGVELPF